MSSYPKCSNTSRPRKRHFHGNQHTKKEEEEIAGQSASAKKLSTGRSDHIVANSQHSYRLIEFFTVFSALANVVICCKCKDTIQFEEDGMRGLGFKLVLLCSCGRKDINSGPLIQTGYEVNRRIVFVMRLLGIGRQGINLFCNFMDICDGLSNSAYNNIVEHQHSATKSVFEYFSRKAVEEEKKENERRERPILNLKVSGDGSWKKRGFKSLYGVTSLIGYYSGKVIDVAVKSSYCQGCTSYKNKENTEECIDWYEEHKENCMKTHEGSAGKMEVDAVVEMFLRSEEKFGVKYGNYIGDGDSKTFKAILEQNPYGDDFPVIKNECIGHVEKRMGSRLRNIKKAYKLGGKGKLTDALIRKLTTYYALAIRRNINSAEDMRKAIMATYYHMCSTDEHPNHQYCPPGPESWCEFQKAKSNGSDSLMKHPAPLHPDVQKHIHSIYEDLSRENLLVRCLGGHTQNANESFNSTVWRLAPKHLNSGLKIVEISTYIAASLFNEGHSAILEIMSVLNIVIGRQAKIYAEQIDEHRITRQERRHESLSKEARKAQKDKLAIENEFYNESEGLLYGSGIAD